MRNMEWVTVVRPLPQEVRIDISRVTHDDSSERHAYRVRLEGAPYILQRAVAVDFEVPARVACRVIRQGSTGAFILVDQPLTDAEIVATVMWNDGSISSPRVGGFG